MAERGGPAKYDYEWTEDETGRLSMAADISSFGVDPNAKKTVMAYLIPNREDPEYRSWYVTDIAPGLPEAGHSAVDVGNAAEGKAFLEKWASEIAMPEMERRDFEQTLAAENNADRIEADVQRFTARRRRGPDIDRER